MGQDISVAPAEYLSVVGVRNGDDTVLLEDVCPGQSIRVGLAAIAFMVPVGTDGQFRKDGGDIQNPTANTLL